MKGAPTTCEFFASQARCEHLCPMDQIKDPEQLGQAIEWVQRETATPYMNDAGEDISGISVRAKDAALRCANQIMRGACEVPVSLRSKAVQRMNIAGN